MVTLTNYRSRGWYSRAANADSEFIVAGLIRIAAFAGTDALIEETTLHGVTRERKRSSEVLACCLVSAAAKLKFGACGRIERIGRETIVVSNRIEFFQAAFRTVALGDGDRAVERDNWRGTNCDQRVVERNDHFPIGVF